MHARYNVFSLIPAVQYVYQRHGIRSQDLTVASSLVQGMATTYVSFSENGSS